MNYFPHPKLRNTRTGVVIEVNSNPFSVGRGLSCNYVLQNKTISRVHCSLEMNDNVWVLKDTSTNGTLVNGKLVKHDKSAPLKNNDLISLNVEETDSYTFNIHGNLNGDITDEELCAIADSVLNEVQFLNSNPVNATDDDLLRATRRAAGKNVPDSTTVNLLHDHMYMAKSSGEVVKKARVGRSPRPILGSGSPSGTETTTRSAQDSNASHTAAQHNHVPISNEASGTGIDLPQSSTFTSYFTEVPSGNPESVVISREDISDPPLANERSARNLENAVPSVQPSSDISRDNVGDEESALRLTQESSSTASQNTEAEAGLAQPGPSTEKSKKPSEKVATEGAADLFNKDQQQDNYEVMENELQCVICSELFIKALTLNCSHSFCKYCIGMWSKNKSDCPICRTKITSATATIVLDNVIEKVIETSSEEIKQHRRMVLEERRKQEEPVPPPEAAPTGRGRGRGRGGRARRGGRRMTRAQAAAAAAADLMTLDTPPRINVLDPVAINIGALVGNNVIELSSDSDWSSDTESMSPNEFRDEYDQDDWYNGRAYYGGYGYCFRCGSPTHWANSCPNR